MKLGPIQKAWVEALRAHPERQRSLMLGTKTKNSYQACCLGELVINTCRIKKKKIPWDGSLLMVSGNTEVLHQAYDKYGLKSASGRIHSEFYKDIMNFIRAKHPEFYTESLSLAIINDRGIPWTTIADVIEKFPEALFDKSV